MNKAIIIGNLVKDPELRTTQSNLSVCSFTVAVNRRFKNKEGGYDTDYINIVAWRQTAEFVAKYFSKGSKIALVGTIQPRSWEDDSGERRYITEVIADEIYFADSKRQQNDQGYMPPSNGAELPFDL